MTDLLNVRPVPTVGNATNALSANSIQRCDVFALFSIFTSLSYVLYLLLVKYRLGIIRANHFWTNCISVRDSLGISSFGHHVCNVVKVGSKEKMDRVHTGPVVAFVENVQPVRDLAIGNYPTQSVRSDSFIVDADNAISCSLVRLAHPKPAIVRPRCCNIFPESLNVLWRWIDLLRTRGNTLFRFVVVTHNVFSGGRLLQGGDFHAFRIQ